MMDKTQTYDDFNDRASFRRAYSFWPRRCYNTGRWVWGPAVLGYRIFFGPGDPATEERWYHPHEAAVMMLKGEIS